MGNMAEIESPKDSQQAMQKRARMAAKCRHDPLLFAEYAWPWGQPGTPLADADIRAWQSIVLDDLSKHLQNPETRYNVFRYAIASGHGIGKSALTGMLTTWALSCYRDPRIVITANTEPQLQTKTSPEVGQWVRTSAFGDLYDTETLSIKYKARPEQHRVDLITNSKDRPEAFAGLHAKGRLVMVIMDEASSIPDVIWDTVQGALTDENTILIWVVLGNPTQAVGMFRECFRENRKFWHRLQIDSRTVEGTNKEALQQIIDQYGEHSDQAKIRVKGQFPNISAHQFIPTRYVDVAFGKHLREEQYNFAPTVITCDPAWTGDDELVIARRQGLFFDILDTMPKNDNDVQVAAKIAYYEDLYQADAVFIDAGYGTGIHSAGTTMGREWKLVWFGAAATDPGYFNKRSEMAGKAKQWLLDGGAIPNDYTLYQELLAINTDTAGDMGIIRIESKEKQKKRLPKIGSPNRADSLFLSFAYPVERRERPGDGGYLVGRANVKPIIANEQFDPYEDL